MHETVVAYSDDGHISLHAVIADLTRAGLVSERPRAVRRTVLDTFDGRLHDKKLRFELRCAPASEIVLSGPGVVPARVGLAEAPRFARDLPPGPLRARVAQVTDVRALLPVVTICETETVGVVRDRKGVAVATVVVHEGADVAGLEVPLPWTVDVVELPGYGKVGAELRERVEALGLRRLDGDLVDLAISAAGIDPAGFTGTPSIPLDPASPAPDAFRAVLANLDRAVEANWQGTIDDLDPEFLHELRVAVRRTRSILASAKRVMPQDILERARNDFAWLGQLTGRPRDLDVNIIEWDDYVDGLDADTVAALEPVRAHLLREKVAAHDELAAELAGPKAAEVRQWWAEWLSAPRADGDDAVAEDGSPSGGDGDVPTVGRVVAKRIRRAQDRLIDDGRAIADRSPATQLHELRKDAKRLRYLLECFAGMFPDGATKPFVRRLKALQENLGQHQDNEVHAGELRTMATEMAAAGASPHTLVAIGELAGVVDRRRADARAAFADIFAEYQSKDTRRLLRDLVSGLDG